MEKFHKDPFPITIDKLKVFITYQAYNNITLSTLQSYITGLSYYFKHSSKFYKTVKSAPTATLVLNVLMNISQMVGFA